MSLQVMLSRNSCCAQLCTESHNSYAECCNGSRSLLRNMTALTNCSTGRRFSLAAPPQASGEDLQAYQGFARAHIRRKPDINKHNSITHETFTAQNRCGHARYSVWRKEMRSETEARQSVKERRTECQKARARAERQRYPPPSQDDFTP